MPYAASHAGIALISQDAHIEHVARPGFVAKAHHNLMLLAMFLLISAYVPLPPAFSLIQASKMSFIATSHYAYGIIIAQHVLFTYDTDN